MNLAQELKSKIKGDVLDSEGVLDSYSHDASIFEVKPQVIVLPKDVEDLKALVDFVNLNKVNEPKLSLTGRSAGTDMSGGSINDSIIVEFTKYFNKFSVHNGLATAQPGVYYRDFEKEAQKHKVFFPSYPASKDICAIGGIINNNSGGEKSLKYGKTQKYVKEIRAVLSDGNEYTFKRLNKEELADKLKQKDFEGEIYRKMLDLIHHNYGLLQSAKPKVSKNSAGYYLWDIYDKEKETFDLTQLFTGSQGTLGLLTEAKLKLEPLHPHYELVTIFLKDIEHLGKIINAVLPLSPESFEAYDDNTLKLAIKYFYSFATHLGGNVFSLFFKFLPEFKLLLTGGVPKLVLLIEFNEPTHELIELKEKELGEKLKSLGIKMNVIHKEKDAEKYWIIRRESFNLLRQKIHNKHTEPFIDDFIVPPQTLVEFLPRLEQILNKYPSLIYTIAGHVGDGNFHIIPLMNISDPKEREIIPVLQKEVQDLVLKYKGSITAEHNDGLIRTPYLKQMYGQKIYSLFEEVKRIFDPLNIFNPRKKVGATMQYSMSHIRTRF